MGVSLLLLAVIVTAATPSYPLAKKETKVLGAVWLGCTKAQTLKILGRPDSPQKFDFFYERGLNEIMVVFNDKTRLAECIIVRGDPKCTVGGVRVGDSK